MKSKTKYYSPGGSNFRDLCLKVMVTSFLMITALIPVSANSLSVKIDFSREFKGSSFSDFIEFVEAKTEYKFFLSNSEINTDQRINTQSIGVKSIKAAIDEVMEDLNLDYKITDEKLILVVGKHAKKTESFGQQQKNIITGVVTDADSKETLPSVTVVVKGTTQGTVTDFDGKYSVSVDDPHAILVFSFIGYKSQEIPLNGQAKIDIQLHSDVEGLDEVVVVGYGTQKKGDITSSVSQVKADDFIQGGTQDAGQLIQGKVAGLTINTTTGDPTGNTEIKLRGINTIAGTSSSPLILIDGIPADFNSVAAEDIESINILKDGSAAAIYGTQGANGVIIITTKHATGEMKNSVSYAGYVSTQTIAKRPDMMNASQMREKIAEGYAFTDDGSNTNWLDEITRTPISHVHNISFVGGDQNTNYTFNVNYRGLQGYFLHSDNEKLNIKGDISQTLFDGLVKVDLGTIVRHQNYTCTADGYSFDTYNYRQALIYNPTTPVKDEDGEWSQQTGVSYYENPVSNLEECDGMFHSNWDRFHGSVTLNPAKDLIFKALWSYSKYNETRGYYETKDNISNLRDGYNGYASYGTIESIDRLLELTGNYSLSINNHTFKILAGYSYKDNDYYTYWMQNCDFPTDEFTWHNISQGKGLEDGSSLVSTGGSTTLTNLIAGFGRINYNYNNKYLLMASIRYEGASQLYGSDNQWGLFPAISGGWRLSNEPFMDGLDYISDLKLRIGYGVTGSQPSTSFLGVSTMGYDQYFYSNGEWIQTLLPSTNANPYIKWEERHETNIGVDYGLFDGKINGTIDYYYRRVKGLLLDYTVPTPPNLVDNTTANVGKMDNQGLEVLVNYQAVKKDDFQWNTAVTFSTNKNKLITLSNDLYESSTGYLNEGSTGEPISTFTHRIQVGQPIGNFYGYKVVGAYEEDADASNDVIEGARWIYEDADGNHVKSEDFTKDVSNKKILGNGIPKYNLSWNNTFNYKKWDLAVTMRGAFGFQILNMTRMYYENTNITTFNRLNSAYNKVYGVDVLSQNEELEFNSYYIEDGDYWKINNVTLGYTFDVSKVKYLKSARIYASCLNCYTITGYKGLDPELTTTGVTPGVEGRDAYPNARTFTFGVNVNF